MTNKYAVAIDIMKSIFMDSDPQSIFTPASEAFEDIAASRAAMDVSKAIDLEVEQDLLETEVASWLALTGNAFVVDGYDNDEQHGVKFVADMACLNCARHVPAEVADQGCPICGGNNLIEARDGDGQPIGREVPIGRQFSEVASPFEMHFDLVSGSFNKSPYFYRARTYPIDVLKDMFPDEKDKIKPDEGGIDSGMFYQTALAYVTNGSTSSPGNYAGAVGSVDNVPRATLYHLWVRPTRELPEGGEALIVGDAVPWRSELTYHDDEGRPKSTVTHFGFNTVPGRVFHKTPADDLVFKQVQHNKIEALIQLGMERTSNGTWLIPKGIGIDNITGEPGEKIWYSALLNGLKPERVGGSETPGSVFRWLGTIDEDIKDISHTRDVLRGQAPEGIPTFGGMQLLRERGLAGFANGLKNWGRGWNAVRRNRLDIFREYASDERVMMVLGDNRQWEAKKFTKESVRGKIRVYLEEASIAPKSKAYDQAITGQLIEHQLLDLSDPGVRSKIMHIFDKPELIESLDIDIKDAVKEKEDFIKSGQVRPREQIDNHQIHSQQHGNYAKSDDFQALPPQAQQIWIQHKAWHDQQIQAAQQAALQNDPHMMNAKAKMDEIMVELQALKQQKGIELDHLQKKLNVNLQAHGVKKGLDTALAARKQHTNGALH